MAEVGNLSVKLSLDNAQFERSVASMNRTLQAIGQEIRGLQNKGKEWGASIDALKQKQDAYSRLLEGQATKVKKLSQAYEDAKTKYGENSTQAEKLAVQLNKANAEMQRTERELSEVTTELKRQEDALARSQSSWNKLGETMKSAGDKLKAVGDKMSSIGKDLSMKVTAPIVALGAGAFKAAVDFESAFAGVRKTVDATEEEFQALSDGIRDMAKRMPTAATEIAAVGEAAGQLGIQKENILSFTETMVKLGTATNMGSDEAATALARLANITKMNQADFDKLGSSIVALGNNFATTESEITEMALRLAGAGAQVGLSEADILGLSAALTSVGIQAEMGGSAFSRVMVNMQMATSSTDKLKAIMDSTGLSLRDLQMMASHSGKAFGNLAEDLGMTKQEFSQLVSSGADLENFAKIAGMTGQEFKKAFETDAVGAIGAFVNGLGNAEEAGTTAINMLQEMGITEIQLRDALLRAGGAAELFADAVETSNVGWEENNALNKEAEERYKTTASQMTIMWNKVKDLGITIGGILIPVVISLMDAISPLIDKFAKMEESTQKMLLIIAGIAAAIGPVLVVIGTLISSVGTIVTTFGAMSTAIANAGGLLAVLKMAFAALTGPIGLAIAAVVGIGTAMVAAYQHFEGFRNVVDNVLSAAMDIIQNVMTTIKDFVLNIWEQITQFWNENGEQIKQATLNVWTAIKAVIDAVMPVISAVIKTAMIVIQTVIEQIWNAIKGTIQGVLDVILGLVKMFASAFTGDWSGLWEGVKQFLSGAVQAIWNIAQLMFFGKLLSGLKTFAASFSGLFTSLWTTIKNLFTSSTGAISKVTTTAFNAIKNVINLNMNTIKTVVTTVWNVIKTIFTTTVNAIKTVVTNGFNIILNTIKNIMTSVVNVVKSTTTKMFNAGKDLIKGLINGIKEMTVGAIEAVTGVVDGVINKAKSLLKIKSPSRVFRDEVGKQIGAGMAIGVASTKQQNEKAIKDVTAVMTNAAKANAAEVAKIADKAEADRTKIQQSYAKKRSNMKKANGKKIAELEKEMHGKLTEINNKAWASMVEKEKELNKQKLEAVKKFVDDKKKANELSLIDEAQYWRAAYQQFKTGSAENVELRKQYQDNVKRINDAITSVNNDFLNRSQKINDDLIQNEQRLNKEYNDAVESRYQDIVKSFGLFEEVKQREAVTSETLSKNLNDQVQALREWTNQLNQLERRKVTKTLLDELKAMGPSAIEELKALNSMTDSELKNYQQNYQEKSKLAREQAIKEMEPLKQQTQQQISEMRNAANKELETLNVEWQNAIKKVVGGTDEELKTLHQVGKNAGQGLLDGLKSMDGALQKQAETMAKTIKNTIQKSLDIHSPSRWMRDFVAGNLAKGFEIGVNDKLRNVMTAGQKLATAITSPVEVATMPTGGNFNSLYGSTLNNIASALNAQSNISMPSTIVVQSVLDGRVVAEVVTPFVSSNQYGNANVRAMTRGVKV